MVISDNGCPVGFFLPQGRRNFLYTQCWMMAAPGEWQVKSRSKMRYSLKQDKVSKTKKLATEELERDICDS